MKKFVPFLTCLFLIYFSFFWLSGENIIASAATLGACCEVYQQGVSGFYSNGQVEPNLNGSGDVCSGTLGDLNPLCSGTVLQSGGSSYTADCSTNACANLTTTPTPTPTPSSLPGQLQDCQLNVTYGGVKTSLHGLESLMHTPGNPTEECCDGCGQCLSCGETLSNGEVTAACNGLDGATQECIKQALNQGPSGTPAPTSLQTSSIGNPESGVSSFGDIFVLVRNGVVTFLALFVLGLLCLAGFTYLTSAGDAAKAKKAQSIIVQTFIGLAIIVFAVIIIRAVASILGINISPFL